MWVGFQEILSNIFTILVIGLLVFSWIISLLLSEDNHESVSNEDYILNGLDDDLDDDLNDDNTIIELPNPCDIVKESDIDNDTSSISEGSSQETESIPNNNLTESIIIRGGFIDSVKDAEDLGLKRLFNEADYSEKPCVNTPSTSTTLINPNGNSIDIPSRSPDNFSPFTPKTLEFLKEEIKINDENLRTIESVCKDSDVLANVREKLLDEKRYYLDQQNKHINSLLDIANKTDIRDVDADKLIKEIDNLKSSVDKLSKDSESIRYRTLKESDTDPDTDADTDGNAQHD